MEDVLAVWLVRLDAVRLVVVVHMVLVVGLVVGLGRLLGLVRLPLVVRRLLRRLLLLL